ncbi:unnamed protein product [Rotaria sp. Silwood1]|nr:unnamed protein product [Rotaria sp. Silwood1]CAF4967343.1 unnamed protein product [Rotaria sp. Silwood1]
MADKNKYEIALIENETDARLCAKLLAEEFASHNPLMVFNQITSMQLFDEQIWPLMMDLLNEKLSFLVRHRSTNEIVATIIANDLFLHYEKHPHDASSPASHNPMKDLFAEMRDQFV